MKMEQFEIVLKDGSSVELDMSIFEIDEAKGKVNLTKIAKACDRELKHWLELDQTQEFLTAFSEVGRNDLEKNQGLTIVRGGNKEQGTWACREIALKFAMWISPSFEVWCIKALDTLFQKGTVSIRSSLLPEGDIGAYLLDVAKRMIQAEDERNMAIKTKAWISDKKTASAMGKYGALVKKTKKLEETVGIYKAVMSISVRSDVRTYSGTDNVQSILNTVLGETVDVDAILCDMGFQKDLPVQLGYKLMNAGQAYSNSSSYTDRKGLVRFNWDYRRTAIAILEFLNK